MNAVIPNSHSRLKPLLQFCRFLITWRIVEANQLIGISNPYPKGEDIKMQFLRKKLKENVKLSMYNLNTKMF